MSVEDVQRALAAVVHENNELRAENARITQLERRIEQLELGMAFRKSAINMLINESRTSRGLEPFDFDEAEKDMP